MKEVVTGRKRSIVISYVISACILVYLGLDLDWGSFLSQIKRTNLFYTPLFFGISVLLLWMRTIRWSFLLPRDLRLSVKELVHINSIGSMSILVLPLRTGEFVRPWLLKTSRKAKFSQVFGSVVIERVFDVLALLVMLGIALQGIDQAPPLVVVAAKALGLLAGIILVLMFVAYFNKNLALIFSEKFANMLLKKHKPALALRLQEMIEEFFEGLKAISSVGELMLVIFLSLLIWLVIACYYQLGLLAFGEYPSWFVANTISVMIALAVAAPSAPGFVGTFQFGCILALSVVNDYSREFGLGYSIVVHVYQVIASISLGLFSLHQKRLHFSDISHVEED